MLPRLGGNEVSARLLRSTAGRNNRSSIRSSMASRSARGWSSDDRVYPLEPGHAQSTQDGGDGTHRHRIVARLQSFGEIICSQRRILAQCIHHGEDRDIPLQIGRADLRLVALADPEAVRRLGAPRPLGHAVRARHPGDFPRLQQRLHWREVAHVTVQRPEARPEFRKVVGARHQAAPAMRLIVQCDHPQSGANVAAPRPQTLAVRICATRRPEMPDPRRGRGIAGTDRDAGARYRGRGRLRRRAQSQLDPARLEGCSRSRASRPLSAAPRSRRCRLRRTCPGRRSRRAPAPGSRRVAG